MIGDLEDRDYLLTLGKAVNYWPAHIRELMDRGAHIYPGEHLARLELRVFLVRIAKSTRLRFRPREKGVADDQDSQQFQGDQL